MIYSYGTDLSDRRIGERYCSNCYGRIISCVCPPPVVLYPELTGWHSTEHWNTRARTTNDYPRVLEVALSHPNIPAPQGRILMPRSTLSRSARRRIRRITKETTGTNIATCRIPLPDDSPPTDATSGSSMDAGEFSSTSSTWSGRPVVEGGVPGSGNVGLSGGVMVSGEPGLDNIHTSSFSILESPEDAMEALFRRFVAARSHRPNPPSSDNAGGLRAIPSVSATDENFPDPLHSWGVYSIGNQLTAPRASGSPEVSALEHTWALSPPPNLSADIDPWDTDLILLSEVPDRSNLLETARHTARLLDAFSNAAYPPVPGAMTAVQERLLTTALTSILAIAQEFHVNATMESDADEVALRPDAACVVCYVRVVDTVLTPCSHLVLCAVCMGFRAFVVCADEKIVGVLCGD